MVVTYCIPHLHHHHQQQEVSSQDDEIDDSNSQYYSRINLPNIGIETKERRENISTDKQHQHFPVEVD